MAATKPADDTPAERLIEGLMRRARAAQSQINDYTQEQADDLVAAAGWAILEPGRNRLLAERAVADTGLGHRRACQHRHH
jgi:sulfoacetaldehyde dehydrogenase